MTVLTQRMREELVRRKYAETTIRTYLMAMEEFRRLAKKRLDHLGPDDIRRYQVGLLEAKKLAVGTVALRVSALRFFYLRVLKKRALKDELPYPKNPKWARRLPTILTPEEHILPRGFVRIRQYGFLANRYRATNLIVARQLLTTTRKLLEACSNSSADTPTWRCPQCGATMQIGAISTKVGSSIHRVRPASGFLLVAQSKATRRGFPLTLRHQFRRVAPDWALTTSTDLWVAGQISGASTAPETL